MRFGEAKLRKDYEAFLGEIFKLNFKMSRNLLFGHGRERFFSGK